MTKQECSEYCNLLNRMRDYTSQADDLVRWMDRTTVKSSPILNETAMRHILSAKAYAEIAKDHLELCIVELLKITRQQNHE